ncbi:DUF771 domain-containing protein [Vagococcus fluvialis]|uniref:DUF771 domain-containing protein n=1 Tax=Vagococcus fluvialis TaxID=2738 RepID=UPI002B29A37F|nr:DUF771 domain-containing protein [Vagococcus fluvialis]
MSEQNLKVNLSIPIPEDSVLITKVEYEQLKKENLRGRKFNLQELSNRTGISKNMLKELFDKPRVRKIADVEKGGFVAYPMNPGSPYLFLASKTIDFIDNNFDMLMKK